MAKKKSKKKKDAELLKELEIFNHNSAVLGEALDDVVSQYVEATDDDNIPSVILAAVSMLLTKLISVINIEDGRKLVLASLNDFIPSEEEIKLLMEKETKMVLPESTEVH